MPSRPNELTSTSVDDDGQGGGDAASTGASSSHQSTKKPPPSSAGPSKPDSSDHLLRSHPVDSMYRSSQTEGGGQEHAGPVAAEENAAVPLLLQGHATADRAVELSNESLVAAGGQGVVDVGHGSGYSKGGKTQELKYLLQRASSLMVSAACRTAAATDAATTAAVCIYQGYQVLTTN